MSNRPPIYRIIAPIPVELKFAAALWVLLGLTVLGVLHGAECYIRIRSYTLDRDCADKCFPNGYMSQHSLGKCLCADGTVR